MDDPYLQGTIVDDDESSFVSFLPTGAWNSTHGAQYESFNAGSYHLTTAPGAYMTFTFNGTYVAYYSDKNYDHGDFLVTMDGGDPTTGNSYASTWSQASLLLYSSPVLNPGMHTLVITSGQGGTVLGLDHFVVRGMEPDNTATAPSIQFTLPPGLASSLPSNTSELSGSARSTTGLDDEDAPSGISKGTVHIIAGFAGGVAVCVLIAVVVWIRRRCRVTVRLPEHATPTQRPAPRRALPQHARSRSH